MKPRRIKDVLREQIGSSSYCAKAEDFVVTPATLPMAMALFSKHRKKGAFIIAPTPGICRHCGRYDDLRFGVCESRCASDTYTDGVKVWHVEAPQTQWDVPAIDRALGRIS